MTLFKHAAVLRGAVLEILIIVALTEFFVMIAVPVLLRADSGRVTVAFIDAALLGLVISPLLWWTMKRTLRRSAGSSTDVLNLNENRFRAIIEAMPECVLLLSADGTILEINPSGLALLETNSSQGLLGKSLYPAVDPAYRDAVKTMVDNLFQGVSGALEFELTEFRGSRRWFESRSVPLRSAKGTIIAGLCVVEDITDHKKLEAQLRHTHKMEAVGTLSGGVAHDFNNILTAIIGYTNILKLKLSSDDQSRTYVDQILASAERATSLTQSLLTFSRKMATVLKPVSVNDSVRRVDNLLRRLIGEAIELRTDPARSNTTVLADPSQIDQVLMNLATNARDAMPDGGVLTIATGVEELGNEFIRANGYGKPGVYVVIRISDTGVGMDQKTRERMFEPFFTTKEVGKGTGLGLSIVYGIVKSHNGFITCSSEPGQGSVFSVYLPLSRSIVTEHDLKQSPVPHGGTETIFIAEDDADVRKLTKTFLENFGYTILEADDGEQAIRRFLEYRSRVHLLLLDVVMPKKSGKQVYDAIRSIAPEIKVLFLSGYDAATIADKGILDPGFNVVSKPVSPETLLKKVREVLDT